MEINPVNALYNLIGWLLKKEGHCANLIDKALVGLAIGKVHLQISGMLLDDYDNNEYHKTLNNEEKAGKYLDAATSELFLFGNQHYIVLALLAKVKWLLFRIKGGFSGSKTEDVDKALRLLHDIREMLEAHMFVLYMTDYHILHANICLYNDLPEEAREHTLAALSEIKKTGYERKRSNLLHLLDVLHINESDVQTPAKKRLTGKNSP